MSAVGYMGATHKNASVAGQTGDGAQKAHELVAAQPAVTFEPRLTSLWSGGDHPETLVSDVIARPITDLTVATDSVRGKLGGLGPRIRSTVAPGPTTAHPVGHVPQGPEGEVAGAVAQRANKIRTGLKNLGF